MQREECPRFLKSNFDRDVLASMAFTTVSARRGFDRSVQPMIPLNTLPVEAPKPQKSNREWPVAVRQYVQRSFAENNSVRGIGRDEMEKKLKSIISEAAESNTLLTIDWNNLALPQEMILAERNKKQTTPVINTSAQFSQMNMHDANTSFPTPSKKRKSSDQVQDKSTEIVPPWRMSNSQIPLGDRITYPEKRPRLDRGQPPNKSQARLESRRKRFELDNAAAANNSPVVNDAMDISPPAIAGPVVGRCQELEKKYFRLTAAPNPDTVRPLEVLKQTLELLKQKWKKERNYSYICDQFKSLRQDLTVQHIKTDFTVLVYEIHARIALEKGDLGEYNQCQTQLHILYPLNLGGHPVEFKAYRILYFIHTGNRTDMNDVLADLTHAEKSESAIKHALDSRSALALGNYHRFFKLYLATPNMGAYLMDMFVGRERLAAISNICKA